ncbi:MAG TPA: proteasome accessory factor PafA2 family protein, partial [Gemmatimonadales bacterium]|nr:proteasome accessory factor PafA2 family protein [Gemmatimonadales bacterium]
GPQTTFFRPLVNTRDEPHCQEGRLHLISFDSTLAPTACLLRVGVTQLVLAMIEAERVNPRLALDDPLAALHAWSHDPRLERKARMTSGRRVTAVELQFQFLNEARNFAARGGFDGIVPRAGDLLDLWQDTLEQLARRDWPVLARRLDWVMKLAMLERALAQRPDLDWSAPELQYLDQLYGSLDPRQGLFWAWSRAGLVDLVVPEERIRHFCTEPPPDTRAWGRAMLLREAGPDRIAEVDWDGIGVRLHPGAGTRTVPMPNPLGGGREEWGARFAAALSLEDMLEGLWARPALARPETGRPAALPTQGQRLLPAHNEDSRPWRTI